MITIGERLKDLRMQKKLTQKQIAEQLRITRSAYALYESNQNTPTIESLKKLAEIYQTSVDYLIGRY